MSKQDPQGKASLQERAKPGVLPRFVTVAQIAEALAMSTGSTRGHIARWEAHGLKRFGAGNGLRYRAADAITFLDADMHSV